MMNVTVRVFAGLVPVIGRRHDIELDDDATIGTLISILAKKTGQKRSGYLGNHRIIGGDLAILVNGKNIDLLERLDTPLSDGAEIVFMPPAAGG
jgi:molybdopterin synthase sulfur carrier subunit